MILSQGEKNQKLWGGRFQKATDKLVEEFNASVQFDKRLYRQDIQGSIAHAQMLGKQGIIPQDDVMKIVGGLKEILDEIETGDFEFKISLEDVHMNIEKRLIDKIGAAGGRLHTARSRNDQVALDSHLYLREEIQNISLILVDLQKTIIDVAEENKEVVMPGYTHLQKAQPILFAHHLMAYFNMLQRDFERLADCYKRVDIMPLGAGALAGTSFPIDREMVASELGFKNVYHNSLDAVSDRDFMLEFLSCASILMVHLSRFSEEIILWASSEFSFIDLDDAYSTGSSIMPQKKNPDVAELTRGKTGRVFGNLMSLLAVMKGLPLAYNKDMQEDKEPLFDTVDTIKVCLSVFTGMLATLKVNKDKMLNGAKQGFTNATDVADYLVKKGLPFRQAHEVVGKLVYYCVVNKKSLDDLALEELRGFSTDFTEDILEIIKVENCVAARNVLGGTAQKQVWQEIERGKSIVESNIAVWN